MRQNQSLRIDNFRLAQRRDGALRLDALYSMRTLKNFDVIYTDGRLRVRPGYTRWNSTVLPAVATQLFYFVPMDSPANAHLLGISNSRWYGISESGAHDLLKDEAATARRPVLTVGERCFFSTDSGWHWTDHASIGGLTKSYRVGIQKLAEPPTLQTQLAIGNTPGIEPVVGDAALYMLNDTDQWIVAGKFTTPGYALQVGLVGAKLMCHRNTHEAAAFRVVIYTDTAGVPSGVPVHVNAYSDWLDHHKIGAEDTYRWIDCPLKDIIELEASTTYWLAIQTDGAYKDIFDSSDMYIAMGYSAVSDGMNYNNGTSSWETATKPDAPGTDITLGYRIGELEDIKIYDYCYTYKNSTYLVESRPSDGARIEIENGAANRVVLVINYATTTDGQVDKVRFYRREVPAIDSKESEITDTYKFVGEVDAFAGLYDTTPTLYLGAILQTQDHYAWDDVDDTGEQLRDAAILPAINVLWKDRVWFATGTDNNLRCTKTLEQDGATGLTNDPIFDYIPLENVREFPAPSRIIALAVLPQDQLAVFFENESVWIVWGANESLNPPADIAFRQLMPSGGLIAEAGLDKSKTGLFFLSREGLYFLPGLEYMSETNQSILDAVENDYITASRVMTFGNEIWTLIDSDNDGTLDTILILDMQRDIPTRQLFDRAWKMYEYNVGLNDIVVKQKGGTQRTVLAADSVNKYILELGDGVDDNGAIITAEVETHDLRARNMTQIYRVDPDALYSGTPPTYTLTLTDHTGATQVYTRTPESSDDIRLHRIGCIFNRPVSIRAKLSMAALAAHELLSMEILYKRD